MHVAGDYVTVSNNVCHDVVNDGIIIRNWPNDGGGVGAPMGKGAVISGNTVNVTQTDGNGRGIHLAHYQDFVINGNYVNGTVNAGIYVAGEVLGSTTRRCTDGTVSGNTISEVVYTTHGELEAGIRISNADRVSVVGNVIRDTYDSGIHVTGSTFINIVGNTCTNSTPGRRAPSISNITRKRPVSVMIPTNSSSRITGSELMSLSTMIRAASYGDSNQDAWAVGMRHSESVTTPNGEPVIFYELVPALTDYDYAVRLAELAAPVGITRDFSKIANWLVLRYKNEFKKDAYITPTTDATLGDSTSQTAYGRRDVPEKILSWGEATQANAINLARRYLEQHKDPVYNLSGALQIPRYVRAKGGNLIPASEIMAGKRIMIEDFLDDLSGTGLTWLITKTTYNDETQICSVQTGTPDPLAILLARLKLIIDKFDSHRRRCGVNFTNRFVAPSSVD